MSPRESTFSRPALGDLFAHSVGLSFFPSKYPHDNTEAKYPVNVEQVNQLLFYGERIPSWRQIPLIESHIMP
ncbi:hypothetical protein RUND412_001634 [Rhizina undulata]